MTHARMKAAASCTVSECPVDWLVRLPGRFVSNRETVNLFGAYRCNGQAHLLVEPPFGQAFLVPFADAEYWRQSVVQDRANLERNSGIRLA